LSNKACPSFTLLIPLFYDAFDQSKRRHQKALENLKIAISENIKSSSNLAVQMKKSEKELKKRLRQNERELNLLMPRRQVRRLFLSLFIALVFIGFYYFQKSHFWIYNYQSIRIISILVSMVSFGYSLLVLWQVFCTIIRIKSEEQKKKKGVVLRRNILT